MSSSPFTYLEEDSLPAGTTTLSDPSKLRVNITKAIFSHVVSKQRTGQQGFVWKWAPEKDTRSFQYGPRKPKATAKGKGKAKAVLDSSSESSDSTDDEVEPSQEEEVEKVEGKGKGKEKGKGKNKEKAVSPSSGSSSGSDDGKGRSREPGSDGAEFFNLDQDDQDDGNNSSDGVQEGSSKIKQKPAPFSVVNARRAAEKQKAQVAAKEAWLKKIAKDRANAMQRSNDDSDPEGLETIPEVSEVNSQSSGEASRLLGSAVTHLKNALAFSGGRGKSFSSSPVKHLVSDQTSSSAPPKSRSSPPPRMFPPSSPIPPPEVQASVRANASAVRLKLKASAADSHSTRRQMLAFLKSLSGNTIYQKLIRIMDWVSGLPSLSFGIHTEWM